MHKISLPKNPLINIAGSSDQFPIRRIFCVGKNYAAHVTEMGGDASKDTPIYFTKSAWSYIPSGSILEFPKGTNDLHHEIELVIAIGKTGSDISVGEAAEHIYGYAAGIDLTRRDLQAAAKNNGNPWDLAKDFEGSALIGDISTDMAHQLYQEGNILLEVNGEIRQSSNLNQMIWKIDEIIANLSQYYALEPGDLIMTGTPEGVSALNPGDHISGSITNIPPIQLTLK